MSAHTPGRLAALKVSDGFSLFDEKWKRVADFPSFDPADPRRLAACWNYFADNTSTEVIEADSNAQMRAAFVVQRDALEKARANLAYYQGVMCMPGAPQYWVPGGDAVPAVTPVRVAELVEQVAAMAVERDALRTDGRAIEANYEAARVLLSQFIHECSDGAMSPEQQSSIDLTERIRAFLKGGA